MLLLLIFDIWSQLPGIRVNSDRHCNHHGFHWYQDHHWPHDHHDLHWPHDHHDNFDRRSTGRTAFRTVVVMEFVTILSPLSTSVRIGNDDHH